VRKLERNRLFKAHQPVFATPPPPPKNWDDAVAKSDLVAHIVLRSRSHVTGPSNVPMDRYDADVIESIKQDSTIYNQPGLVILRLGGMVETPTAFVRQNIEGFPDWSLDRQYLMFLRFNPVVNAWNPRFGPEAVFEVRTDAQTVQTHGRSQFARAQHLRPLATVLSEVRASELRMRGRGGQ
jgi:hypothetical protein